MSNYYYATKNGLFDSYPNSFDTFYLMFSLCRLKFTTFRCLLIFSFLIILKGIRLFSLSCCFIDRIFYQLNFAHTYGEIANFCFLEVNVKCYVALY